LSQRVQHKIVKNLRGGVQAVQGRNDLQYQPHYTGACAPDDPANLLALKRVGMLVTVSQCNHARGNPAKKYRCQSQARQVP
jgi:hypothetical protein